jgi:CBS domain containing-hemolysin-like protein
METLIKVLAVFLLVAANGFFVTSEFAIVSVRRMRIAALAEAGNKRARRLLAFKDNLVAYISATQLGVTLSSLALGWIGEATLAEMLAPRFDRLAEATRAVRRICLDRRAPHRRLGHSLHRHHVPPHRPRRAGSEDARHRALGARRALRPSTPMYWFSRVFRGPIRLLDRGERPRRARSGCTGRREHASVYTEEEIKHSSTSRTRAATSKRRSSGSSTASSTSPRPRCARR